MSRDIVAVIPISASDPEFVNKQIPRFNNRSVLSYTITTALEAQRINRVIVSTESAHIANMCELLGAEVPFLRPSGLSNPGASITDVLSDVFQRLQETEGYIPEWGILLTITYPFRRRNFIDDFIETVLARDLDSALPAIMHWNANWIQSESGQPELVAFGSDTAKARKKPFYRELGGLISMATRDVLLGGSLYGQRLGLLPLLDMWATINIHDPIGRQLADLLAPQFQYSEEQRSFSVDDMIIRRSQ